MSCVYSREAVRQPPQACETEGSEGNLNCHGYGSSVTVTATFGMVAASEAMREVLARVAARQGPTGA